MAGPKRADRMVRTSQAICQAQYAGETEIPPNRQSQKSNLLLSVQVIGSAMR